MVQAPGPLRAFYERTRVRRGGPGGDRRHRRKLACLFWCLLVRGEDYAYGQPSLKRRSCGGSSSGRSAEARTRGEGIWKANEAVRKAERELADQAEAAYKRTVADEAWRRATKHAARRRSRPSGEEGAGATPGRAS